MRICIHLAAWQTLNFRIILHWKRTPFQDHLVLDNSSPAPPRRGMLPSFFLEAHRLRKVPLIESLRIIGRGSLNWFAERPIVVSFEVTDACTCFCKHCDHGGPRDESRNLKPADYRRYMEALRPCVVQVSGGEPLLRDDVVEIVRNIKGGSKLPYTILVSNWSLMTPEKYLALRQAGIDQFSVSLDFPDERHDDFRAYPGLYRHLEDLIPRLAKQGHDDIVLNCCITSENVGEIGALADKAREWGVNLCYSAYSARRTGCRDYFLNTPEQLAQFNAHLDRIEARRDQTNWIVNTPTTLEATRRYFANGGTPGCKAGLRFLVVTADGALQPCSMQFQRYRLEERTRMIREFTSRNQCGECYVSIRSNLDKSFPQLLWENVSGFFSFSSSGK
jgi:MoaA/NifB/PqqE/SkfB family radical SAM enzyme